MGDKPWPEPPLLRSFLPTRSEGLRQRDSRLTSTPVAASEGAYPKRSTVLCAHLRTACIYDGIYSGSEIRRLDEFEWDENNEDKLAVRHGVDRYEAEEAATDPGALVKRIGADRVGNPEYVFVGKTEGDRILFMVAVLRKGRIWRIGSARDAMYQEKRAYRKRNR